jgi:hypothetical protein
VLLEHEENIMVKLTDTQLIVLSKAAGREDGLAVVPTKMHKAAASKVGSSLVGRKLMREVRSKPGMPIWGTDADDRPISLLITGAGRDAIGIDDEAAGKETRSSKRRTDKKDARAAQKRSADYAEVERRVDDRSKPRVGTKQALVIEMLIGESGTTLDALIEATHWLPHTTRAALTGLRKRGYSIARTREDGKNSIYRIVSAPEAAA